MSAFEVIVIGGGPAGLTAAILLGRCRRNVLLLDQELPRNRYSHGIHNFITRDDMLPADFMKVSHLEIKKYGVQRFKTQVETAIQDTAGGFVVTDAKGRVFRSRKLVLATGLTDNIPEIEGVEKFYGKSVVHCPYCDGWENSDKQIGVYAKTKAGVELAISMKQWSSDITLFTDGENYVHRKYAQILARKKIKVVARKAVKLTGKRDQLQQVVLDNGDQIPCDVLFFSNGYKIQSDIPVKLGCIIDEKKVVITNREQKTNIPGLYVAGDASKDVHFVIVAAAEGAKAGLFINKELLSEDLRADTGMIPFSLPDSS